MALQRVRSNMLANNFVLDDDQGLIVGSGNNLYIDTANNRVGINTTSPNYALEVNGDLHATGNITAGGNITLGDSDADTLTITAEIGSDILPDINNTYDLGSTTKKWAEIHATTFYGDGSQLTGLSSTLDEVTTNGATTTNSITVGGLIVNSTGALGLPVGTTAERPTAADGLIRFNSDLVAFEGYDGVEWGALGGGGAVYATSAPTTNLKAGDLWFDTGTTGELYVYSGTEWLSTTGASGSAFYTRSFTGDNSTTAYTVGGTTGSALLVYLNGVLLSSPADYSYSAGTVTFVTAPPLSSEIIILVYGAASGVSLGIGDLTDVDLLSTPPTNDQVLVWDAANNKFVPGDAAADFTDLTGQIALTQIPDALITPAKLQTGITFVDEFTANGSTASFTLSRDPGTAAAIQVFVDSVPQLVSNYTVVGTTLTLSGTPTTGQIVEVRGYGIASLVGTVADLSVTTQKLAANAVTPVKIDSSVTTDVIGEGSTNLYYTDARVQSKMGSVSGSIIPDTDITYDLGSATNRFRDLYLSGNSITLGTRNITQDNIPEVDLSIAPEILEIQVDAPAAGQDTQWVWTWLTSSLPYARRTITNSPELSVPLYKQGTYTVNNYAAYDLHGSMTQTHSLYLKWIDGAGTDNLVSWATSTGPVSDTHPDINGGAATDVQRINISVPATVTPPTLTAPNVSYTVTNNGVSAYTFSGTASGDNPNIGPFYRGGTYTFNINATGHPLYLTTDNGTNFSAGTYFGEYTNGVTGSRTDSGTLTIVVPNDAPSTLYYQCGNHGAMRGAITVKDLAVETNINGNYVLYFQHTQEGHKTPVEIRPIPSLVNQMCLVYDASVNKFVPQDLATYVENTPSFENKIREVAGTAELVVEDGSAVIAKVNVYDDSTYLPLVGNNPGDQAFATDTDILYIWDGSAWQQAGASNSDDLTEGTTNLFYTDARVGTYLSANGYDTATNIVASITDSAPATLDTLNELAAALGDDPNFATTVTNSIATKAPISNPTFTGVVTLTGDLVKTDTGNNVGYKLGTAASPSGRTFLILDSDASDGVGAGSDYTYIGSDQSFLMGDLTMRNGSITATSFIGDGSQLTGLPAGYTDSDVASYLNSGTSGNVKATGHVESVAGFFINDVTISSSYSIPTGKNAMTAGPVTIADGVVIEIPDGSTWTVM